MRRRSPGSATSCARWPRSSARTAAGEVARRPYGVPDWAARQPGGCERADIGPRSRPITDAGLQRLPAADPRPARARPRRGRRAAWWSPWNEPNQPFFISPQRRDVRRRRAGAVARRLHADRPGAARRARRATAPAQLVLGEMAGVDGPTPRATGIARVRPRAARRRRLRGDVWSQHALRRASAVDGRARGPVGQLARALDRARLHARQADLGDRDRRRRCARRRGPRHEPGRAARGVPYAGPPAAPLAARPARRRRVPVHVPRGHGVPRRPRRRRASPARTRRTSCGAAGGAPAQPARPVQTGVCDPLARHPRPVHTPARARRPRPRARHRPGADARRAAARGAPRRPPRAATAPPATVPPTPPQSPSPRRGDRPGRRRTRTSSRPARCRPRSRRGATRRPRRTRAGSA